MFFFPFSTQPSSILVLKVSFFIIIVPKAVLFRFNAFIDYFLDDGTEK